MSTSAFTQGVPDTAGGPFLDNVNAVFRALASFSASSSEPPVYDQAQAWFDLNSATLKLRNPQNTAWVPILKITSSGVVPIFRGMDITQIATLAAEAGVDGYVSSRNGQFVIENIDSPDIAAFGINRGGIVPGVTAADADARASLRADATWRNGPMLVASRSFAGAQEYVMSVPKSDFYNVSISCGLSNTQSMFLQIGNSGVPIQTGYRAIASRAFEFSEGTPLESEKATQGFQLWRTYNYAYELNLAGTLVHHGNNKWTWNNTGGALDWLHGDICRGEVTIPGSATMDIIRITAAGSPRGSFNNRGAINTGAIRVYT